MPVRDWTRVDAGTFHGFHTAWITHLSEALNGGLLPEGFYALPEQHGGRLIADVLTLQTPSKAADLSTGGLAVAEAPPQVGRKLSPRSSLRSLRRTLTIRHATGHRVIALIELVSPSNKDRATHVNDFVDKATNALWQGIHVLVVDVFRPGPHDPQGMPAAIWQRIDEEPDEEGPFSLGSFVAAPNLEAYLESLAPGDALPNMPLFLSADRYVNAPLESTYEQAFRGLPKVWRDLLE